MSKRYWVYIMASKPWGTLYVGVTGDIESRVYQHRETLVEGFTKRYDVKRLVHFEEFDDIGTAIQREKRIKKWPRAWKINLIRMDNPDWKDLAADWYPKLMSKAEIENWVARIKRAMTDWVGKGLAADLYRKLMSQAEMEKWVARIVAATASRRAMTDRV